MDERNVHIAWGQDEGAALPLTLVLIALMMTLGGVVLMVGSIQYRFVRSDVHDAQARQLAEAGIYEAFARLHDNPHWRPADDTIELINDEAVSITVEPYGSYLWVEALAEAGRSQSTVRVIAGERPPLALERAVVQWDTQSSLNVAGTTSIVGDIVVGERGVVESTFKTERFVGEVDGTVYPVQGLAAPYFDTTAVSLVLAQYDAWARGATSSTPSTAEPGRYALVRARPSRLPVRRLASGYTLSAADSTWLNQPHRVVVAGNLTVQGPLRLPPLTHLLVRDTLVIQGAVSGDDLIGYAGRHLRASGPLSATAQLFSQDDLHLGAGVRLDYPSVVYVDGRAVDAQGRIHLEEDVVVNGMLMHPPQPARPQQAAARIRLAEGSLVRGAVYNGLETEVHGLILGHLWSYQFYFFETPTNYINWLKDVTIDVTQRPQAFALPPLFSPSPHLEVVRWAATDSARVSP
ncbi:MAG: hypothetical protein AAF730_16870 [Bacteroidota bacterium]